MMVENAAWLSRKEAGITNPIEVLLARKSILADANELGFPEVDATKLATAVSELARNVLEHGGGGKVTWWTVDQGVRCGLKAEFEDRGTGIRDVEGAMTDGFTTGGGMGMGLPGARRLVDELEIDSVPGQGTRITITKWLRNR